MERIQWLAIIHLEKSNPTERWYIPPLPPGIPIATSVMYGRPNHFREMLQGMPDTFFNRIGTSPGNEKRISLGLMLINVHIRLQNMQNSISTTQSISQWVFLHI